MFYSFVKAKVKNLKLRQVFNGNPSQNYRVSLAIWDHTMLLATRHTRTHPAYLLTAYLPQPVKAGTRFTYPGGMEG